MAEVTIGLVAYNGAATLRAALDSLLAQSFEDYLIILSDNASTDATAEIGRSYAGRYSQIRYVRRPETWTYHRHFGAVLNEAASPYFMWAPADDIWAPGFLAAHHAFLAANPDYVASQGRVLMLAQGFPSRFAQGTFALRGTPRDNIRRFLANPADNSRFYGLYRTEALRQAYPPKTFYAFDWSISAATLASGRHNEHPDVLMLRDETPAPRYAESTARFDDSRWVSVLPLLAMTRDLWGRADFPHDRGLAWALATLNGRLSLRFWSFRVRAAAERYVQDRPSGLLAGLARWYAAWSAPGAGERRARRQATASVTWPNAAIGVAEPIVVEAFGWQPLATRPAPGAARVAPAVSVVLVVRNQLLDVLALMQALPRAIGEATYELLIADRGSVDATALCLTSRPDLLFLALPANTTVGAAAATAASRATGEVVILLDAGTVLHEGMLSRLASAAGDGRIAGPLWLDAGGRIAARGGCLTTSPTSIRRDAGTPLSREHLVPVEAHFCLRALAVPRVVLERLGGFGAAWQSLTGTSADLSTRARRLGVATIIVPDAVVSSAPPPSDSRDGDDEAALAGDLRRLTEAPPPVG